MRFAIQHSDPLRFLSPDGRCYTFDERANGYARGEGVGVLLLKPLSDALRDGDTVRAVIRGTGSSQDGRTPGITMPNGLAQEELIRSVYERAGLDPLGTSYVECHGTGFVLFSPSTLFLNFIIGNRKRVLKACLMACLTVLSLTFQSCLQNDS